MRLGMYMVMVRFSLVDASFYASLFLTIILRGMGWSISASLLLVGYPSCWIDAEI